MFNKKIKALSTPTFRSGFDSCFDKWNGYWSVFFDRNVYWKYLNIIEYVNVFRKRSSP